MKYEKARAEIIMFDDSKSFMAQSGGRICNSYWTFWGLKDDMPYECFAFSFSENIFGGKIVQCLEVRPHSPLADSEGVIYGYNIKNLSGTIVQ